MSTATEFYRGIAKKKSKNLWIRKRHNGAALNRLNRTQGGGRWAKALKRNDPNAKSGADNSEIPHVYLVQTVLKSLLFVCIFLRGIRHCSSKTDVLLHVHRNRRLIRDGSPGRPPRLSHSSWALFLPNPNIFHWLSLKELPGVINLIPSNRTSAGCPLKALTDHTKCHGRFTGSLLPPPTSSPLPSEAHTEPLITILNICLIESEHNWDLGNGNAYFLTPPLSLITVPKAEIPEPTALVWIGCSCGGLCVNCCCHKTSPVPLYIQLEPQKTCSQETASASPQNKIEA